MILAHLEAGGDRRAAAAGPPGQRGSCGGGFDRMSFPLPPLRGKFDPEEISTAIDLNHRKDGTKIKHRHPRLRRRHVLRLDQPEDHARPGHGGQGVEHLHLHRRGRLPRHAHAVQGPCHHPDRHRSLRRQGGDHQARPDSRVQVCPGRQARPGRPPAPREEHARGRQDEGGGAVHQPVLPVPVPQRLLGRGPQEAPRLDHRQ